MIISQLCTIRGDPDDRSCQSKRTFRLRLWYFFLPVRVLLDHLVDPEQERVVAEGAAHTLLVEAELGCGDGLALRDQREVELELLVVTPLRREFPVVLDCGGGKKKHTQTGRGAREVIASSIERKKKRH